MSLLLLLAPLPHESRGELRSAFRAIASKYKGRMDSRLALATYHLEPIKVLEYILRHGSEGVGSPACPILDGIFGRGHVGGFGP